MRASVVSGCDTAPVLELGEEVLHLVALAIEHLVVGVWLRIPGINRTVFRSKTGRHSDMKPDAIPINNRTV